jgi:hypothetical protein
MYEALCMAELIMSREEYAKLDIRDALVDVEALLGMTTDEEKDANLKDFMHRHPGIFGGTDIL